MLLGFSRFVKNLGIIVPGYLLVQVTPLPNTFSGEEVKYILVSGKVLSATSIDSTLVIVPDDSNDDYTRGLIFQTYTRDISFEDWALQSSKCVYYDSHTSSVCILYSVPTVRLYDVWSIDYILHNKQESVTGLVTSQTKCSKYRLGIDKLIIYVYNAPSYYATNIVVHKGSGMKKLFFGFLVFFFMRNKKFFIFLQTTLSVIFVLFLICITYFLIRLLIKV